MFNKLIIGDIDNDCSESVSVLTSRTQSNVSLASAEAELYAMTQASVESLAIKHFIQENWGIFNLLSTP